MLRWLFRLRQKTNYFKVIRIEFTWIVKTENKGIFCELNRLVSFCLLVEFLLLLLSQLRPPLRLICNCGLKMISKIPVESSKQRIPKVGEKGGLSWDKLCGTARVDYAVTKKSWFFLFLRRENFWPIFGFENRSWYGIFLLLLFKPKKLPFIIHLRLNG